MLVLHNACSNQSTDSKTPPVPILSQVNPVHVIITDFFEIHFEIFLSPMPRILSGPSLHFSELQYEYSIEPRGSVVGWGTMLQARRLQIEIIGLFIWSNPSGRTVALGSTHPPAEMSTRNLPGCKGRPAGAKGWQPHRPLWTDYLENVSQPYGPPGPVTGIALPFSSSSDLSHDYYIPIQSQSPWFHYPECKRCISLW
jgi:hypothetical protein